MSRTEWPKLCTLAEASRLFETAGVTVHRSNLSRFISSRGITKVDGKVDPIALFATFTNDFGRQTMAGQTGNAAPGLLQPSAPAFPASSSLPGDDEFARDDPKRDLLRTQATRAQLELDKELGKTVPAEEAAAAMAEAIAELRAAMLQAARDEAARLLADLKAPGHMTGIAIAALKRFAAKGQEAFAQRAARVLEPSTPKGMAARERLDALVAFDLDLRGETDGDDDVAAQDPAVAPTATTWNQRPPGSGDPRVHGQSRAIPPLTECARAGARVSRIAVIAVRPS